MRACVLEHTWSRPVLAVAVGDQSSSVASSVLAQWVCLRGLCNRRVTSVVVVAVEPRWNCTWFVWWLQCKLPVLLAFVRITSSTWLCSLQCNLHTHFQRDPVSVEHIPSAAQWSRYKVASKSSVAHRGTSSHHSDHTETVEQGQAQGTQRQTITSQCSHWTIVLKFTAVVRWVGHKFQSSIDVLDTIVSQAHVSWRRVHSHEPGARPNTIECEHCNQQTALVTFIHSQIPLEQFSFAEDEEEDPIDAYVQKQHQKMVQEVYNQSQLNRSSTPIQAPHSTGSQSQATRQIYPKNHATIVWTWWYSSQHLQHIGLQSILGPTPDGALLLLLDNQ